MSVSEASVATTVPSRYLSQLCKHFQHKIPVTLDDRQGRIQFSSGVCELEAVDDNALRMRVTAADEATLAQLEDVVARHLQRFAFRDEPDIRWIRKS